ncbi:response regulator [Flavobacterium sp.]|uniref:response regulator n=1 Tax=Flavobacterium sp. TaxID=239 RepID=UPI0025BFD5CA|nr:response regulator [Flavobacterium sp.]
MKILIVEDHFAMIEGYRRILEDTQIGFEYFLAHNCQQAIDVLSNVEFNLILLDINIPSFGNCESGYDLAFIIKNHQPSAKLLVLTSYIDKITLYSIYKEINPNGILVKSDFSPEELIRSIYKIVFENGQIFSATVLESVEEIKKGNYLMDEINRKLLALMGKGFKTNTLSEKLRLSISSVDKRKALIKEFMGIEKGNDEDIIVEARRLGLL